MITKYKIIEAQKKWGDGIVKIGTLINDESALSNLLTNLLTTYMNLKTVRFCSNQQRLQKNFRPKIEMALSYFIGGINSYCKKMIHFAMKPWVEVEFENSDFIFDETELLLWVIIFLKTQMELDSKLSTLLVKTIKWKISEDLDHSSLLQI